MDIKETIGIDVSKNVIDVCIHSVQLAKQFQNNNTGFNKMILWTLKNSAYQQEVSFFVFEYTGMYSDRLSLFLEEKQLNFKIVPGLEIKRSLGITRGKDDKVDAKRIALYAYRLRDELTCSKNLQGSLRSLKSLLTMRKKLVKHQTAYKATLSELKKIHTKKEFELLFKIHEEMILFIENQIQTVNKEMNKLISSESALKKNYLLLNSIKGVGQQTATIMLVYTDNFTKFETWRKFASYCGIAPFPYKSGSSVRGRDKVSHLANKFIKVNLSLCACSALQHSPEIKEYYNRRIESGKSKTSTNNVIRNKLVSRMFAVIKRQTPYVDTMKFAA